MGAMTMIVPSDCAMSSLRSPSIIYLLAMGSRFIPGALLAPASLARRMLPRPTPSSLPVTTH